MQILNLLPYLRRHLKAKFSYKLLFQIFCGCQSLTLLTLLYSRSVLLCSCKQCSCSLLMLPASSTWMTIDGASIFSTSVTRHLKAWRVGEFPLVLLHDCTNILVVCAKGQRGSHCSATWQCTNTSHTRIRWGRASRRCWFSHRTSAAGTALAYCNTFTMNAARVLKWSTYPVRRPVHVPLQRAFILIFLNTIWSLISTVLFIVTFCV